ncbi:dihydroorotase [Pedobacter psychrophilus]|uniref:Dihydroorotase n=1 Tax=Pedobacter psychrophilus TaxID=1826909 RepID=A0A179DIW3_9SPHI|nr:dihydroorotase [Pedobacter psychrophilus]OAQ40650.1 dihydroorotase [Pedobacter psychrophilus]
MAQYLIKNATIVNEGKQFVGDIYIKNQRIEKIGTGLSVNGVKEINAEGKYIFPGFIDDQVHFREPGLTHKAEIYTESRAAVAGGITSFMEMPNTVPNTLTQELLADKYAIGAKKSLANYSFFMGASNDNLEEVLKTDVKNVCGIKVFMGSSTGNMLVDNEKTLEGIFKNAPTLVSTHCEDETTIRRNLEIFKEKYGEDLTIEMHPLIRSEEACYLSSSFAVDLAKKHNTRLHILHISTGKETFLFDNKTPLKDKRITAEACIHHLWFSDVDYKTKGNLIKWNPAVKTSSDKNQILKAVLDDHIDVIATDHAPHTIEEKAQNYSNAPSGGPLVQHAFNALFEMYHQGKISLEKIAEKTAHNLAICFQIKDRGFIREGYYADLVLIDLNASYEVNKANILAKCGWSPFEGQTFNSKITHTFVSGHLAYADSEFDESILGERLKFDR